MTCMEEHVAHGTWPSIPMTISTSRRGGERREDSKCARSVIEEKIDRSEEGGECCRFCKEICGKQEASNVEINSILPCRVVYGSI